MATASSSIASRGRRPAQYPRTVSWVEESKRPLVRAAHEFRKELGTRTSVPTVSIFGYGLRTTTRIDVQRDSDGKWENVTFVNAEGGDDTIYGRHGNDVIL